MIKPLNNNLYNISSSIQNNSMLNRSVMEIGGVEIPFCIMANNQDERNERILRSFGFASTVFVAPVISMPLLNRFFLKKSNVMKDDKEINILQVSKEFLAKDSNKMIEGFKKTALELKLSDKEKFKDIDKHFNNVLSRFSDKEVLRKKLAKVHSKVFLVDFLIASASAIAVPWISNFVTEKRTKRSGYVGEFKIADEKYTSKMSENHKNNKQKKLAISFLIPILGSLGITKIHFDSMIKPEQQLGKLGKLAKKHVSKLDYKNAIFMSKAGYLALMLLGDMPSYFLACRDKHELKMRVTCWSLLLGMMFGGDFLLNNIAGRICDAKFATNLMDKKGFENAGFFKKFLMKTHDLSQINKIKNVNKQTKTAALIMYWSNFALTTACIGFGMSFVTNRQMKKDVQKDLNGNLKIN